MEGNKARTTSLYDGEAREIAHVKHVSDLVSKVSIATLKSAIFEKKRQSSDDTVYLTGSVQTEVG